MDASNSGYDQTAEDQLLAASGWEHDGYRLFSISTLAASSARGWFAPMGESNALFMAKSMWAELGGFDERFALPGGGLSNHDLYRRACELDGAQLVVLLGEGTFHQIHGGAATSGRVGWDEMHDEYVKLRGRAYQPPTNDRLYVGSVPDEALPGCQVRATVKVTGPTGVEMEALTAVSVACLTIYDMIKAVERGVRIEGIHLVEKMGGKSGHYRA